MIEFFAAGLAHNWQWIKSQKNFFHDKAVEFPNGMPNHNGIHNLKALLKTNNASVQIDGQNKAIRGWMFYCDQLGMEKSKNAIEHFFMLLNNAGSPPNFSVIDSQLGGIVNSLWFELFVRKFTFIPEKKVHLFEQEKPLGELVYDAFPSARSDAKAAGNCLAADLNTAAVFHLMRIVEIGLRKLAAHLKVPVKKSQLEYLEWNTIIGKIEKSIADKKSALTRGKKKSELLEFYHGIMGEFNAFKDVWRNNVMHSRNFYNEAEAMAVYIRVQSFMQRLAAKISES
jgi:hypothetical protein